MTDLYKDPEGRINPTSVGEDEAAELVRALVGEMGPDAGENIDQDVADDSAAILRPTAQTRALILQNRDAFGDASDRKAQIYWYNSDGSMAAAMNSRPNQNRGDLTDFNLYLRETDLASSDDVLAKKLSMLAGPGQEDVNFYDVNNLRVNGSDDSPTNILTDSPAGQYSGWLCRVGGENKMYARYHPSGYFGFVNEVAGASALRFYDDGLIQFRDDVDLSNNSLHGIRTVANASPDTLDPGEIAVDTDRGGTGSLALLYQDDDGTNHYWEPDGTL